MIAITKLGWLGKYKWRLDEMYQHPVTINLPVIAGANKYVYLANGTLTIYPGYCWDGASGPTWDTISCRRSSMVHDALYQLMREGKLKMEYKALADELLRSISIEDGMWKWRANAWYWAVTKFGSNYLGVPNGH